MNIKNINRRTLVTGGIAVASIIVLAIAGFALWRSFGHQEVSAEEPLDIAISFYDSWLAAVKDESADPYKEGLAKNPLLGKELRQRLAKAEPKNEGDIDPVICQTPAPEAFATRRVSESETRAEVLMTSRDRTRPEQTLFTLARLNEGWYIVDIRCSPGEVPPEREFTFDREGNLLKSVPAPLNSEFWHLVFAEDGTPGHFAPLIFGTTSICVAANGAETACDPAQFRETSKARVQGEMTETGVQVKRLQFLK